MRPRNGFVSLIAFSSAATAVLFSGECSRVAAPPSPTLEQVEAAWDRVDSLRAAFRRDVWPAVPDSVRDHLLERTAAGVKQDPPWPYEFDYPAPKKAEPETPNNPPPGEPTWDASSAGVNQAPARPGP